MQAVKKDKSTSSKSLVCKFGGTSVGSIERIEAIADKVAEWGNSFDLAVVLSAMSGETNRLAALVKSINPSASGKALDLALATGEQLSIALLGAALEKRGIEYELFLAHRLGIKTDETHNAARILSIESNKIHQAWAEKRVAIVAGFQGIDSKGNITTLGRGGSDTSAVALAVALNACRCEIWTDVDGVFTANPKVVSSAKIINELDYESALEMASLGSKVLHSRCVEIASRYKLPLLVKNSFNPGKGTCVMEFNEQQLIESPAVSGIACQDSVARVDVFWPASMEGSAAAGNVSAGAVADVFDYIAEKKINVDVIIYNEVAPNKDSGSQEQSISFTVDQDQLESTRIALQEFMQSDENIISRFASDEGYAKVSLIGVGMKSYHGVASRTFRTLQQNDIQPVMVSTSEIKISIVLKQSQAQAAQSVLHDCFCSE